MRKLLLATAATFGVSMGLAGGAKAQPVKPVAAPGTLVVHLNGYLEFSIAGYNSTFNRVNTPTGAYKLNDISTIGDFRIYPGFDGETRNGINYGVQAEIRTGYSNAGVGQGGKTTSTSTSTSKTTGVTTTTTTTTQTNTPDSLYVKRAYAYIGTPAAGYGRFGQTDSAFTLLQNGVVEAFGDGGQWTLEGGVRDLLPSGAAPSSQFIYADQAAVYSTDKIVYISPAISGFNIAVGYEPNSNGIKEGYNSCAAASSPCAALSSSPVAGDVGSRRKNTVDAMVQYVVKANGFAIKASAGVLHGAPIGYDGPAIAIGAPLHYGYDTLNVYQGGAQVTYAGVTLGANIKAGQVEDGYTFKPRGARDALAFIVGANYVLGPMVVGASYYNSQSSGTFVPGATGIGTNGSGTVITALTAHGIAPTLSEYGVAVGANYVLVKSLSLYTQYMYGHRHQPGSLSLGKNGNAQVQVLALGATLKW